MRLARGGPVHRRILYLWDADYPWDVRTEKICRALADAGHHVVITARNLAGLSRTERRPEGTVERLWPGPALGRRWRTFPAFFNPFWLAHVRRQLRHHAIDTVLVRDLPLAPTALAVSAGRIPVVLDMAENYPAMIRDIWTDRRRRPLDVLVRNPSIVAAVERRVLQHVDHVLTVVEESSTRLHHLGVAPARVSVVSNTPSVSRIGPPREREPGSPLRVVYLGLMEHHRGVGAVLDAAAILRDRGMDFVLDLIGDGRDVGAFEAQAARLGLAVPRVRFRGRLPHPDALAAIGEAHVGLVPHEARESWNTTIPNKLFDYMAAGLAVVTSDARPAARIVRDADCGLVFGSADPASLAENLLAYRDEELRRRHGRNGQEAIRRRHNWEHDTRVLLDVVAALRRGPGLLATSSPSPEGEPDHP